MVLAIVSISLFSVLIVDSRPVWNELVQFIDCNVHKPLQILHSNETSLALQGFKMMSNIDRIVVVQSFTNAIDLSYIQTFNIVLLSSNNYWEQIILDVKSKPAKSFLVLSLVALDWTNIQDKIREVGENVHFYITVDNQSQSKLDWFEVMSLKGQSQSVVVNEIRFNTGNHCVKEYYNLQGLPVTSVDKSWEPYMSYQCEDLEFHNCQVEGALIDIMTNLAKQFNFTHKPVKFNGTKWGGLPNADTSMWEGVLGETVNGMSHLTMAMWGYNALRFDVLDFVPIVMHERVLVAKKQQRKMLDLGLFTRPFTKSSWTVIFGTLLLLGSVYAIPEVLIVKYNLKETELLLSTVAWYFFVIVNAYFGGAMTMFFATDETFPFHDIRDVIRAYPDYHLIIQDGNQNPFTILADNGDEDFQALKLRWEESPEEVIYESVSEGLQRLQASDNVIMLANPGVLRGHYRIHPYKEKNLMQFGRTSTTFVGMLLPKNSPMTNVLKLGVSRMRETGKSLHIIRNWEGTEEGVTEDADNEGEPLIFGQLVSVFIFLVASFIVSAGMFLAETSIHCLKRKMRYDK